MDIAKGIGIILMVVGHITSSSFGPFVSTIYLFHMSLFSLCQVFIVILNKSFLQSVADKASRLLIPYVIYFCKLLSWIC